MLGFLCLCISVATNAKLIEYRPNVNFGQVFHDYSGNSNHGVNGLNSIDTTQDTIPTDRGAYFTGSGDCIRMPPNDIVAEPFGVPSIFSLISWVNLKQIEGYLFLRILDSTNYFVLVIKIADNYSMSTGMQVNAVFTGNYGGIINFGKRYIGSWSYIVLVIDDINMSVYLNNQLAFFSGLSVSPFVEIGTQDFYIGGMTSSYNSFSGFIWYFAILTNDYNYPKFLSESSSACLTSINSCVDSCSPAIDDPYKGIGCISLMSSPWVDDLGNACPSSLTVGCSGTTLLICGCSEINKCKLHNGVSICICPNGYTASSTDCFICDDSCDTCSGPLICDTCIALNSYPDTTEGCNCYPGYYGTKPLSLTTSCSACYSECITCNETNICLTCIAINTIPTKTKIKGCDCIETYGGISPLITSDACIKCDQECLTCNTFNTCLTCIALNSIPHASKGCTCIDKYWGNTLTSVDACTECHQECATCNGPNTCSTCIALNALPNTSTNIGCICIDTYFGISPLSLESSCSTCNSNCATCIQNDICLTCIANNSQPLSTFGCQCNTGYFNLSQLLNIDSCLDCHGSCLTCIGSESYQCISCNGYYLYGYCLPKCPVGYIEDLNNCNLNSEGNLAFKLEFKSVSKTFYDTVNEISAESASLNDSTFAVTRDRGVYLSGKEYLIVNLTDRPIFSPVFTFTTWINPYQDDVPLISKGNLTNNIFSVSLSSSAISVTIMNDNLAYYYSSINKVTLNEWNHILISFTYSANTECTIILNNINTVSQSLSKAPFLDYSSLYMLIGHNEQLENTYNGFIFYLSIYIPSISLSDLISTNCNTCSLCPVNSICIANCGINSFYSNNQCTSCPAQCPIGCFNSTVCSICADQYCTECSSFLQNSCTLCENGSELISSLCVICNSTSFFITESGTCKNCEGLCLSCNSESVCTSCIKNSSLKMNQYCVCDQGFTENITCIRNLFTGVLSVSSNNTITIIFSESLSSLLTINDFQLFVGDQNYGFTVDTLDSKKYSVVISNLSSSTTETSLKIVFIKEITSATNSLLSPTKLASKLFIINTLTSQEIAAKAEAAESLATTSTSAGLSGVLGLSILNFDPTTFFNFINTAELFYSSYLFNLDLGPEMSGFLIGMRVQSKVPNVFSYFLNKKYANELSEKLKKYGFKTNLFLLNIGVHLSVFSLFIVLGITAFIASKFQKCKNKLTSITGMFRYKIFLRFWVQFYFELFSAAIYAIMYCNFMFSSGYIDVLASGIAIVVNAVGFFFVICLIYKRNKLINEEEIKSFLTMYSFIFEEFNCEGTSSWMFYLLFVIRRSLILVAIFLIDIPVLQLTISLVCSLSILFYITFTKAFKSFFMNIYHILNEFTISMYYLALTINVISGNNYVFEHSPNLCRNLIFTTWALNIIISLIQTVATVITKVRNFMKKYQFRAQISPDIGINTIGKGMSTEEYVLSKRRNYVEKSLYHNEKMFKETWN